MTNSFYNKLTNQTSKGAIVARGIMDHFQSDSPDHSKLRACQEYSLEYAQELGVEITGTSTTSNVAKLMRDAGVFQQFPGKPKRGEGYVLVPGPHFDEFSEFLEDNADYGTSVPGQTTMSQLAAKTEVMEHFDQYGAFRIGDEHRVPSATYNLLRTMLNDGKLDVIFVKPGAIAAVKHKKQTVKVGYWDE